jgi:hypothetical protein
MLSDGDKNRIKTEAARYAASLTDEALTSASIDLMAQPKEGLDEKTREANVLISWEYTLEMTRRGMTAK